MILEVVTQDWTLVSALLGAIGALTGVVGLLWWRYNQARDNYEALLMSDRDDLVPAMVRLTETAKALSANSNKLLEESIKLRTYRRGDGASGDARA